MCTHVCGLGVWYWAVRERPGTYLVPVSIWCLSVVFCGEIELGNGGHLVPPKETATHV